MSRFDVASVSHKGYTRSEARDYVAGRKEQAMKSAVKVEEKKKAST
jgi:hypothetical protein